MGIKKIRWVIVGCTFALATFLILFHFTDTPRVWVDEGLFTNVAETVALHGVFGIQTSPTSFFLLGPLLSVNYPVIFPVATSLRIFGNGIWQSRLPMILYMFGLVVVFYLFAKKRYGFYSAIMSILLLISFSPFYGNGRSVLGEVPGLFFLVLASFLLLYVEESGFKNRKLAVLSGLFFGLAAATKSLYLLMLIVIIPLSMCVGIYILKHKSASILEYGKAKKNIAVLLVMFCVPIFLWFWVNFPTVDSMLKIIPTFMLQSGNNGASTLSSTSLSTTQTIFVNLKRFVTESTPILFLFLFVVVATFYIKKYVQKEYWSLSMSEYILFFIIVANGAGYLLGTGWYRYFFPANILLYLIFPISVLSAGAWINVWAKKQILMRVIYVIPFLLFIFQMYHLIFLSDTSFVNISTKNDELSSVISQISSTKKVLFYNTIDVVVFLKGGNYSQYFAMPGLFEAGDKEILKSTSYDYILVNEGIPNMNMISSCYSKTKVNKYLLFQKTSQCR